MIIDDKQYVANPDVSCGDEGAQGAVLFNPDTDDVMILNLTGKTIWDFIKVPRTLKSIAAHLEDEFNISSENQTINEVNAFIEKLMPDFVRKVDGQA